MKREEPHCKAVRLFPLVEHRGSVWLTCGGAKQLAFTHTYTGELKNHRRQATFHFTQDSLKQQCAQFCA